VTVLTAANTALVLDSTADLPDGPQRYPNLRVVPLTVRFGDEEYRDYVDLTPDQFYARLADSPVLPKTSAPSPEAFGAVYRDLFGEGGFEHVVSLHVSGKLSGTLGSARLAASEWGDRITLLDSATASAAIALCALRIEEMLAEGTDVAAITDYVERYRGSSRVVFTLETLEYLEKGGRIGHAQALLGNLLSVRPILGLSGGVVEPIGRVRGAGKVLGALGRELEAGSPADGPLRVAIAHACAPETAQRVVELVASIRPQAVVELVTTLGAVIGVYGGPGAYGLMWMPEAPTSVRAR
jgi:DegV family protein with EDD domain